MRRNLPLSIAHVILLTLLAARFCIAADLQIAVVDVSGQPVSGVVLIATSDSPVAPAPNGRTSNAAMDQINKEFVPEVLVVRTGTQVAFPNSDSVAHQVYSFSPTKRFALPLYRGRPYPPVSFDQPGLVTLGCNIHDYMVGYIVVTDSPYFGQSGPDGRSLLHDVPPSTYRVSAWHPRFNEPIAEQVIALGAQDNTVTFRLTKPLRPPRRSAPERRVRDY